MLLYHGTLRSLVPKIFREGLRPQVGSFVRAKHGDHLLDGTTYPPVVFACDVEHMWKAKNAIGHLAFAVHGVPEIEAYDPLAVLRYGALLVIDNTAGILECPLPSDIVGEDVTTLPGYPHVEWGDYIAETTVPVVDVIEGDAMIVFLAQHHAFD